MPEAMTPLNNNEPKMDKNYWLAIGMTMLIVMGYPYILRKLNPPKPLPAEEMVTQTPAAGPGENIKENRSALSLPETPSIERPVPPATIRYANAMYELDFSTLGASVTRLLYKGEPEKHEVTGTLFYEGDNLQPGLFGLKLLNEDGDLSNTVFKLFRRGKSNEVFEFVYEMPGQYRLSKKYILSSEKPSITLDVSIENLSAQEKHFPFELNYAIAYLATDREAEAVVMQEKVESKKAPQVAKKGFYVSGKPEWAGLLKKYFGILVRPQSGWQAIGYDASAADGIIRGALRTEPVSVEQGGKITKQYFIYAGPQRYETLKEMGFEDIFARGFFGIFKLWLLIALKFLSHFTHNYGWAIILLTIGLKGLFAPLTHMSYESMKKMQAIQPKLKSLQQRYKNDPQKLNREMMELYRRNKVNPMGGCLPMVLQIPIFIAFYQVLNETIELKGADFIWWVHDLSQPDRLFAFPFTLPVLGDTFNLLPLFMIGSMVWQQKLTPQAASTPEQTQMMNFMPLIFGFLFYKMPSGLVLYWFVNNVLTIIHQIFIKRMVVVLHHEDKEE